MQHTSPRTEHKIGRSAPVFPGLRIPAARPEPSCPPRRPGRPFKLRPREPHGHAAPARPCKLYRAAPHPIVPVSESPWLVRNPPACPAPSARPCKLHIRTVPVLLPIPLCLRRPAPSIALHPLLHAFLSSAPPCPPLLPLSYPALLSAAIACLAQIRAQRSAPHKKAAQPPRFWAAARLFPVSLISNFPGSGISAHPEQTARPCGSAHRQNRSRRRQIPASAGRSDPSAPRCGCRFRTRRSSYPA